MHQQNLDEDGLASSYLILTAMLPLAIFLLYRTFKKKSSFSCNCINCRKARQKPTKAKTMAFLANSIFQGLLWIIIAMLVKNILTLKIKRKALEFDPYKILNVSSEASLPEIKRTFRKKIKAFKNELSKTSGKEKIEESIRSLNNAFNLLKDPVALSSWMNDTSSKEMLIALPSWLLNFTAPLLFVYIFVFAIAFPAYFFHKQIQLRHLSFSGCNYCSNEIFLNKIDSVSELPQITLQNILWLMGNAVEIGTRKWNGNLIIDSSLGMGDSYIQTVPLNNEMSSEDRKSFINDLEMNYAFPVVSDNPGYLIILAYLFRKLDDAEDIKFINRTCLSLTESFMKIALAKEKAKIYKELTNIQKMINQAVFLPSYYLLQYPHVSFKTIIKNANLKDLAISDDAFLNEALSGSSLKDALHIYNSIPRVSIKDLEAFTISNTPSEDQNEASDKLFKKEGDVFLIEKNSAPTIQFKLVSENYNLLCHTPFSQDSVENKWMIICLINDKIHREINVLKDFSGTKNISLHLPVVGIRDQVKISVISSGYFGNDIFETLNIKSY